MVKTNIERLEGELNEVFNEFFSEDITEINLTFSAENNKFLYTVTCGDKKKRLRL